MKRATKATKAKRKPARKSTRNKGNSAKKATRKTAAKRAATATTAKSTKKTGSNAKGRKAGAVSKDSRAAELRSLLEAKRAEIIQEIRRARQDSVKVDRASYAEVGDLVSASVEKEKAFEYGEIGVQLLREIDSALEKLKEGTFGICEVCAKPIGVRRLKVMPSARLCIKCKSVEEASGPGARGRSLSEED